MLARLDIEGVREALQRAIPLPQHEVGMRRALRRQVLRQGLPLATRRKHVADGVQNLSHVHLAPAAAALGRRNRRRDQRPLAVAQIARITQAVAVRRTAMLWLPHRAPLGKDSGAPQGITTDSPDSTTLWIGSKHWRAGAASSTAASSLCWGEFLALRRQNQKMFSKGAVAECPSTLAKRCGLLPQLRDRRHNHSFSPRSPPSRTPPSP